MGKGCRINRRDSVPNQKLPVILNRKRKSESNFEGSENDMRAFKRQSIHQQSWMTIDEKESNTSSDQSSTSSSGSCGNYSTFRRLAMPVQFLTCRLSPLPNFNWADP